MSIAPSGFDQNTPRPTVASLGDAAAVDGVSSGAFAGYETEIPHQLARSLKARQIADLGQHRHRRNEIYPIRHVRRNVSVAQNANAPTPIRDQLHEPPAREPPPSRLPSCGRGSTG